MDDFKKKIDHQHEQPVVLDEAAANTLNFFQQLGSSLESLPLNTNSHDYMSQLMVRFLKVDSISRGRVTCSFSVLPPFMNYYKGLQGGVVATVAERLATACARTIVGEEKSLFLGEQSISYLSAASMNDSGSYMERRWTGLKFLEIQGLGTGELDLSSNGWHHTIGLHGEKLQYFTEEGANKAHWTPAKRPGELLTWYKAELVGEGKVLRSGRNITVVSIEIKVKETKKLLYISQATLYHLPIAKL